MVVQDMIDIYGGFTAKITGGYINLQISSDIVEKHSKKQPPKKWAPIFWLLMFFSWTPKKTTVNISSPL
jgi:hypothetical protein